MNLINWEFIFTFILPQLISATSLSVGIGAIVGGIVGLIMGAIARRVKHTIIPAIIGSVIGTMLLAMIPIFVSKDTYIGGPYAALGILQKMIFLVPAASIIGSVVGVICDCHLAAKLKPRLLILLWIFTYTVLVVSMYVNLAPPPFQLVKPTPQEADILPLVGKITGYEQKFSGYYRGIRAIAFTPDSKRLVVGNVGDLRVWEIATSQLVHTFPGPAEGQTTLNDLIDAIAITPDNQTLVTAAPQQIQVRELATGEIRQRFNGSKYVQLTPDGKTLIGFQQTPKYRLDVGVWEISSGKLLHTIPTQLESISEDTPLDITPDSKTLVLAPTGYTNKIEIWQLDTGKRLQSFGGDVKNSITTLTITPDGKNLITAQKDNIQIWDIQTKKVVKTITNVGKVKTLLVSRDSQTLISSGDSLNIWQLSTNKKLVTHQNQKEKLAAKLAISPDGKILAATDDKGVRLWQLAFAQ